MSPPNNTSLGATGDGPTTESTSLLGAGTRDGARAADSGPPVQGGDDDGVGWTGDDEFSHVPRWRRASVYWLLGPYIIFTLAFGGSIVTKLNLILDLICNRYLSERAKTEPGFVFIPVVPGSGDEQCASGPIQARVQRQAATFMMAINLITGLLSVFTVPKVGSLSDRFGRKRLLVVASAGGILGELVIILAAKHPETVHLNWLLVAAAVDGLCGSFTASSVVSHSYVSDCTPPRKRGVAIGYLHSCLYSGLAFGPLLAGYLVDKVTHDLVSVFYITLFCHIFFVLFILTVLPESVSRKRQVLAREKHAEESERRARRVAAWAGDSAPWHRKLAAYVRGAPNPLRPLKVLYPRGPANGPARRNLVVLAAIDTMLLGISMGSGQVTIMYSELMFGWRNLETSNFVSLVSLVRLCALLGLLPLLNHYIRVRPAAAAARRRGLAAPRERNNAGADRLDLWLLRGSIISDILGVGGYIVARTSGLFIFSAVVASVGALAAPSAQSAISKQIPVEQIGGLLGAIGLLHALVARVIFPLAISGLYAATVEYYPQAVYVLLVTLFGAALFLAFLIRPHVHVKYETEPSPPQSPQRGWAPEEGLSDDEAVPVRVGRG